MRAIAGAHAAAGLLAHAAQVEHLFEHRVEHIALDRISHRQGVALLIEVNVGAVVEHHFLRLLVQLGAFRGVAGGGGFADQGIDLGVAVERAVALQALHLGVEPEVHKHVGVGKVRAPGADGDVVVGLTNALTQGGVGGFLQLEVDAQGRQGRLQGQADYDIAVGTWSPDFADPYMFMNFWFDSKMQGLQGNRSFYSNPQVDSLIREAATTSDTAKRVELYQSAQKMVLKDSVYAYLYQKSYTLPMRDSVKGYVFNPMLEQVFNLAGMSK